MNSCECHPGFRAYRAPGFGCYKVTSNDKHTKHTYDQSAVAPVNDTHSTSYTCRDDHNMQYNSGSGECECKDSMVQPAGHDFCVPHYVFNIHGRIYILGNAINAALFNAWTPTQDDSFNNAVKDSFGIDDTEIYTYRAVDLSNKDQFDADQGTGVEVFQTSYREKNENSVYQRIMNDEDFENKGMCVSFVIHSVGSSHSEFIDKMNAANIRTDHNWGHENTRMDSLKDVLNSAELTPLFGSNTISSLEMYLWALTASYKRPVAKQPFAWAPTKTGNVTIPVFPTFAPNGSPVDNKQRSEVNFKIGLACWGTDGTENPHDMEEFSEGYIGTTNRAKLERALENMLNSLGQGSELGTTDIIAVHNWHPEDYDISQVHHYNPLWYNKSITVEVRMQNFNKTVEGLNKIMEELRSDTFKQDLANELATTVEGGFDETCIVPPKDVTNGISHSVIEWGAPTRSPTRAPARPGLNYTLPGGRKNCQSGVNIELRGRMQFLSTEDLDASIQSGSFKADDAVEEIYDAFANHTKTLLDGLSTEPLGGRSFTGCNIVSQTWKGVSHNVEPGATDVVSHPDDCNSPADCKTHVYTIDFTMAIPTDNMHEGNKIFHDYEFQGKAEVKEINSILTNGYLPQQQIDGKSFDDWTLAEFQQYRPYKPLVIEIDVFSLELAFIRETVTNSPTPRPTHSELDCEISEWSSWTECSASCGDATKSRYRIIEQEQQGAGKSCDERLTELGDGLTWTDTQDCTENEPCPQDCIMEGWQSWGDCETGQLNYQTPPQACGTGTHNRINRILQMNSSGGLSCETVAAYTHPDYVALNLACDDTECTESKACSEQPCPTNCTVTDWTNWTDCSQECGSGTRQRHRAIDTPAYYGGHMNECDNLTQSVTCNQNACPEDCVVSEWSAWGSCDKSCGGKPVGTRLFGAKQIRTRYVLTPAESGGHKCPSLTQSKLCALHPCGAQVCKSDNDDEFPLTCTYENGIVYTHHVNDVHKNDLFMCYHNYVTEVCTCLCWPKANITGGVHAMTTAPEPEI